MGWSLLFSVFEGVVFKMKIMQKSFKKVFQFILFIYILFLVFSPIFFIDFGIHNDYSIWEYDKSREQFPETIHLILVGRPIGAYLLNIYFRFFDTISSLAFARFISFIVSIFSAFLIYRYLSANFYLNSFYILSLIFCIFTLPPNQVFVIWSTNFVPGSLNIFFVISIYIIFNKIDKCKKSYKKIFLYIIIFILFLATFFIYPPTSLFFLCFTFINALFSVEKNRKDILKLIIRDVGFCIITMISYFLIHRFILLHFLSIKYPNQLRGLTGGPYEFKISTDFFRSVEIFYVVSKLAFGGSGHAVFGDLWALIVIITIIIGIIFLFKKRKIKNLLFFINISIFLMLLSNICVLVSKGGFDSYRVIFPYSSMVVIFIFWIGFHLFSSKLLRNILILLFAIFSGICASLNLTYSALSANIELNFIRQKLSSQDITKINSILFIKPKGKFIRHKLYYEFQFMATNLAFIKGIVDAVLSEMNINSHKISSVAAVEADKIKDIIFMEGTGLIIDMNQITVDNKFRKNYFLEKASINVSEISSGPRHSGIRCFDKSTDSDSFWETKGFPQMLQITFEKKKKIVRYKLCTGELPERMPKAWLFQGSNDLINWNNLDIRENQINWKINEKREFKIVKPSEYKYYRFVFNEGNDYILRIYEIKIDFRRE